MSFSIHCISKCSFEVSILCLLTDISQDMESIPKMFSLIVSIILELFNSWCYSCLFISYDSWRLSSHHLEETLENTQKRILSLSVDQANTIADCFIVVILSKKQTNSPLLILDQSILSLFFLDLFHKIIGDIEGHELMLSILLEVLNHWRTRSDEDVW